MDAETFKEVFLPFHRKLYRVACRLLQDSHNAEDVLQDTYIKLWNKRSELDEVKNAEVFAIVILRNTCLDYLRKNKNGQTIPYEEIQPASEPFSGESEIKEKANQIYYLIDKLPEIQRQVMKLKHQDGYSDQEIEHITGLSAGNIRVIISRARKVIREQVYKMEQPCVQTN